MPTLRPRIQVTETEELTRALAIAEEMWPGESKSTQVCRLAALGAESAIERRFAASLERQEAIAQLQRELGDTFAGLTLKEVRAAWERE
jgi:hypothetical protein